MSETKENRKRQIKWKNLIILFGPACLVVLSVLVISLVQPKSTPMLVPEATFTYDNNTVKYRFTYDTEGRVICRESLNNVFLVMLSDEKKKMTYYLGGCGIYRKKENGDVKEYFFVTDPLIYSGSDLIDYYVVGASGGLSKVVGKEMRYSINSWEFDSNGRPIKFYHNDTNESYRYSREFRYDNQGRVIHITESRTDAYTDIVYEDEKKNVCYYGEDGNLSREEEYDGQRLVRKSWYDSEGSIYKESKYYYPNGTFPLPSITSNYISSYGDDTYMAFESVWLRDSQTWEKKVEFTSDGQPLREEDLKSAQSRENIYDKNGMLCEQVLKDAEGKILDDYEYKFDKYGNLIRYSSKDGKEVYQYKWK